MDRLIIYKVVNPNEPGKIIALGEWDTCIAPIIENTSISLVMTRITCAIISEEEVLV